MASRKKPKTFAELVTLISERYHEGKHLPMAERLGVASALVPQWAKGTVKRPGHENVARLCRTYDLDYWGVQDLIAGKPGADPFGDDHGWRKWMAMAATVLLVAMGGMPTGIMYNRQVPRSSPAPSTATAGTPLLHVAA
jgi:hypothetical protein